MPANNIVFMEGFEYSNTISDFAFKWNYYIAPSITKGRHDGNCVRFGNYLDYLSKYFTQSQYVCASFAYRIDSYPSAQKNVASFGDNGTSQIELRINTNGTLSLTRNGTALTSGTGTSPAIVNAWNWIEVKLMISDSINENSCQVMLNNKLEINLPTGTDTKNTANAYANVFNVHNVGSGLGPIACFFDDIIVQSGVGSDFLGDTCITSLFPNNNGDYSDFIGNDGNSIDNYLLVDDPNPDNESTYVESGIIGNKDVYSFPTIETTASSILALELSVKCRKTDAGFLKACYVTKIGLNEQDGPTISIGDSSIPQIQGLFATNPFTSLPWNQSEAESLQLGQKLVS